MCQKDCAATSKKGETIGLFIYFDKLVLVSGGGKTLVVLRNYRFRKDLEA